MEAEGKARFKIVSKREIDAPAPCALENRSDAGHLVSSRPMDTAEVGVLAVTIRVVPWLGRSGPFPSKLLPEKGFCRGLSVCCKRNSMIKGFEIEAGGPRSRSK